VFKRVAFLTRFYAFKSSGKMRNFAFIKKSLKALKNVTVFSIFSELLF
jgi:hypothetical protein